MAAVAAYGERGGDFDGAFRRVGEDAGGDAVLLDEAGGLPAHAQGEGGEVCGFGGEEVEEVPLRHERDEFGVGGQVGEVGEGGGAVADGDGGAVNPGVADGEEFVEEAKLVHELERGGMDGVAAEVAEEVGVLFKDGDVDGTAGEEIAEHDAGGASADDAAGGWGQRGGLSHDAARVTMGAGWVKGVAVEGGAP